MRASRHSRVSAFDDKSSVVSKRGRPKKQTLLWLISFVSLTLNTTNHTRSITSVDLCNQIREQRWPACERVIIATLAHLIIVDLPNEAGPFILSRNHVNDPLPQCLVVLRDLVSQLCLHGAIGGVSVKRANYQVVYVHPDRTGPIVVAKTIVGIVDAQTTHTVFSQHTWVRSE